MKIELTIDDDAIPFTGHDAYRAMAQLLPQDIGTLYGLADAVRISGPMGIYNEER